MDDGARHDRGVMFGTFQPASLGHTDPINGSAGITVVLTVLITVHS